MARCFFQFEDMSLPESGADFDEALERYYRFAARTGLRDGFVARQVHGTAILEAGGRPSRPLLPTILGEGDAVWTSWADRWVGVFTADCLPLLFDAGDRVMAVHAGWRGLAAGILGRAVDTLGAASIRSVTLGPAAKGCCYEVGPEVVAAIEGAGVEPVMQGRRLDLPETARRHLRTRGVASVAFSEPFGCTICDRRFRSYRREGESAGRNLAAIARETP